MSGSVPRRRAAWRTRHSRDPMVRRWNSRSISHQPGGAKAWSSSSDTSWGQMVPSKSTITARMEMEGSATPSAWPNHGPVARREGGGSGGDAVGGPVDLVRRELGATRPEVVDHPRTFHEGHPAHLDDRLGHLRPSYGHHALDLGHDSHGAQVGLHGHGLAGHLPYQLAGVAPGVAEPAVPAEEELARPGVHVDHEHASRTHDELVDPVPAG